jgi:DoxX-like protein
LPLERLSGSMRLACLRSMHVSYVVITIMAALATGYAASLNFLGAESVKVVADRVHVSAKWMVPFGTLLAAGALGLLAGLAVPVLGEAAAIGLVVYFICAVGAHLRARDPAVGGAISFLVLVAAALVADLGYHGLW